MNANLPYDAQELWRIAGWTMVHYLWLGAILAAVAFVCCVLLRRAQPNVRYATALVLLTLLAALPLGIAGWLIQSSPPLQGGVRGGSAGAFDDVAITSPTDRDIVELSEITPSEQELLAGGTFAGEASPNHEPGPSLTGRGIPLAALDVWVAYLPWLWIMGTPITFLLLAAGIVGTKRFRRASRTISDGAINQACSRLASSLHVTRRVTIAVCDRIAAPVLVGIIRPIILLPPAALTGWSPEEIEMVLLHELAHVRRWDNFLNLLQRLIESLLFFHPAVWLVSAWVRREREACCDAIVVARTHRPHAYAELLVALAAQPSPFGRGQHSLPPSPSGRGQGEGALATQRNALSHPAASAMAAGPLRSRIRRILDLEDDPMLISPKSFTLMLATLLAAATLAVLYLPTIGQAEETTTEVAESAEDNFVADSDLTQKNLKRLVMALHNNLANRGSLPANAIYNDNRRPLLSWRVHVLPFLGEEKLYREFHLKEPWDSKHNKQLIDRMPDVFKNPKIGEPGKTNYLAVVGAECAFTGTNAGLKIADFIDGTSTTIALVGADVDHAVEWTRPQDWEFDRHHPTRGLGSLWGDHWYGAWVDGSVRRVENSEPDDAVGTWFTRAGREIDSLKESEGERPSSGAGTSFDAGSRFPSLEEQKLADLAYERLRLELEPIDEQELERVKALGYEGGLRMTSAPGGMGLGILVGLHVWPTTSLENVAEVLNRNDLAELTPLKYYIVDRNMQSGTDVVRTGRIPVIPPSPQPVPIPKMPYQPPQPTPLPVPLHPKSIEDQLDALLAQDPQWAKLQYQLAIAQMQLAQMGGSRGRDDSRAAAARLQREIEQLQAQIAEYRERVKEQMIHNEQPPPKSALRYEAKTFDEWRRQLKTELSTEKRLEAVKALAAFGANGYGKEAAEAILEVVKQYDWGRNYPDAIDDSPTGELKTTMIAVFRGSAEPHIPVSDALSILAGAVRAGDPKLINFSEYVLSGLVGNEDIIPVLVEMSRDDKLRAVRRVILRRLQRANQEQPDPRIAERMIDALSENSESAHIALRALYKNNPPFMAGMTIPRGSIEAQMRPKRQYRAELVDLLNRGDKALSEEVVEVLGLLGANARPALPSLYPLLLDADLGIEALIAIRRITGSDQSIKDYLEGIIADGASPEQVEQARVRLSELEGEKVLEGLLEKGEPERQSLQQD